VSDTSVRTVRLLLDTAPAVFTRHDVPRELPIQTIGEELTAIRDRVARMGHGW
jgi:hypothetical protein